MTCWELLCLAPSQCLNANLQLLNTAPVFAETSLTIIVAGKFEELQGARHVLWHRNVAIKCIAALDLAESFA